MKTVKNQTELDGALRRFEAITRSMLSLRALLTLYMSSQMLQIFGSRIGSALAASVWPFAVPRGMKITDFYLTRPDVQAALLEYRSSRLVSSTLSSLLRSNHGSASSAPAPAPALALTSAPSLRSAPSTAQQPGQASQVEPSHQHDPFDHLLHLKSLGPLNGDQFSLTHYLGLGDLPNINELNTLTRASSHQPNGEYKLSSPVDSILGMLSSNDWEVDGVDQTKPRPLSDPVSLVTAPPAEGQSQRSYMQTDLPLELEDLLVEANNRVWGNSRGLDTHCISCENVGY